MAKITPYHQQKLDSARVGTAGVNQAGNILDNSQISNAEQLTNAELSARSSTFQNIESQNSQNATGLSKALIEHQALANEQQNMNDEHLATAMSGQFAMDMLKKRADILGDKQYTPDQYPDLFAASFKDTASNYTQGMNANQQDRFAKLTQTQQESFMKQAYNDKIEYGTKNAQVAQQSTEQRMVKETTDPDSWGLTKALIADPEIQRNFLRQYESPEAANKAMNGVLHDAAMNAVNLNLNKKPALVEQWLDSGELTDAQGEPLLTGKEVQETRTQILNNKATIVKIAQADQEITRRHNEGTIEQAIGKAYIDPKVNIASSQQTIRDEIDAQTKSGNPDKQYLAFLNSSYERLDALSNRVESKAKEIMSQPVTEAKARLTAAEAYSQAADSEVTAMKAAIEHSKQTPDGIRALNTYNAAMKELTDPGKLRGSYAETQQLNKAHAALVAAAPYMLMPGEENKPFFNAWAAIQNGFTRIKDGRTIPDKLHPVPKDEQTGAVQEAEKYALMMSRPAPEILHRALNPTSDPHKENVINGEFVRQAHEGVAYWQQQLGKAVLTETEKRGVDNHVTQNMLRTPGLVDAPIVGKPSQPAPVKLPVPPVAVPMRKQGESRTAYADKLSELVTSGQMKRADAIELLRHEKE